MEKTQKKLSNLQLELLKVFAHDVSDAELMDIRRMLADYFMKRAIKGADRAWKENEYSSEKMKRWLKKAS